MSEESLLSVKIAVVPTAPLVKNGKQFVLKFVPLSRILELLSEKQHFDVLVYTGENPDGYKIRGKYNSEKKRRLVSYLKQIDKKTPIDMLRKEEFLYKG